jgi:glycosyltransferase involved in cell wall biosynthesis
MKILIISTVTGPYSWAGSEELWKLMALEALRQGHTVTVCLQDTFCGSTELNEFREAGGTALPLKPLNWIQRRFAPKGLYSRFRKLERFSPDIICLSGPPAEPFRQKDLCQYLERSNAPKTYILQGNDDQFIQGIEERHYLKKFYAHLAGIVCVSEDNAVVLRRQIAAHLANVAILPNPIRTKIEKPLIWPRSEAGTIRFATVGRYEVWSKGQDITMEALSSPEWRDRNWEWHLYGCGPDEEYLADLINFYGLQDKVRIMGFERDFTKIWPKYHMHLLCSRGEGLALALIESMFCGRPALVTLTGGNHELVRDGLDGFICKGSNSVMIRETLERAWKSRDEFPSMGTSSYNRVKGWVPENLGGKLLELLIKFSK